MARCAQPPNAICHPHGEEEKCAKSSITEPRAVRQHCLENGLKVARRSRDDAQHLGGCRLLLQRLGEVGRALAQFIQQSRILDGNDSLGGEILQQGNLLVSKWANLLPIDSNATD